MSLKLKITITSRPGYTIDRQLLRQELEKEFNNWVSGEGVYQITINLVGDRKIKQLKKQYLNQNQVTDVLSFPLGSLTDTSPDNEPILLGDIVISYPQAKRQAYQKNQLVTQEVIELAKHGLRHLLGIHHN